MALYTVTDTDLTSIADAIREKGGSSAPLAFPGGFTDAIGAIQTGGGSGSRKNLVFIDYDGTEVSSYTTAEALALSSLPANPTHTGLTAQGWNWSLASIKSYLTDYPDATVNVGQMYITDDGKTRIYITLDDPDALSPYLAIAVNGEVLVDWGDSSTPDTMIGSSTSILVYCQHVYDSVGDYVITIETVGSGKFAFLSTNNNVSCLTSTSGSGSRRRSHIYSDRIISINVGNNVKIESYAFIGCSLLQSVTIPNSVTHIGIYAFQNCYSLQSVTIPDGITSINSYTFNGCYALQSVAIPDSVTSIGNSVFNNCYSLQSVTIPDGVTSIGSSSFYGCQLLQSATIPDGVTSIGSRSFYGCYALQSITIPDGVTSIGDNAFTSCCALQSITIPDSVISIGTGAFSSCYSLQSVTIPDGVTSIGNSTFSNCLSLQSVAIPDGVTSIGNNSFYGCCSLQSITIPDGVISIENSTFQNCYSLQSVTIPNSVTSIGTNVFAGCYDCCYHFNSSTPPTLSSTNAFNGIQTSTIIYVPYSSDHSILEAYKTATNWSTYASYMQEEPQE